MLADKRQLELLQRYPEEVARLKAMLQNQAVEMNARYDLPNLAKRQWLAEQAGDPAEPSAGVMPHPDVQVGINANRVMFSDQLGSATVQAELLHPLLQMLYQTVWPEHLPLENLKKVAVTFDRKHGCVILETTLSDGLPLLASVWANIPTLSPLPDTAVVCRNRLQFGADEIASAQLNCPPAVGELSHE